MPTGTGKTNLAVAQHNDLMLSDPPVISSRLLARFVEWCFQ